MNIQAMKYHECPQDQGEGILLADLETEKVPYVDKRGNMLYYCLQEHHIFPVPTNKAVTATVRERVTVA
jgi:hypothetical protein